MERSAQEIREEMATILRVPVSDNIENVDEHELQYGLEDSDLDRFEELRRELEEAIAAGRLEPEQSNESDENKPEQDPEPEKTPEQLAEERFGELSDLIERLRTADNMSQEKQEEINRKIEDMRNETRIVRVDELKAEVAGLESDKREFDEMTRAALEDARKEATQIQQESEKAFNEKLVEFLNRKNAIELKLKSMRERGLTPEKLAIAERSAQKALDDLNREMADYKASHFEKRSKLDDYIKYIENSIGVTYADVKYEAPEKDDNEGTPPPAGDNEQGKDGDDGQGKDGDGDNGGTPPPAGDNGQGKDGDDGQGKDGDGDNGGTPPPAGDNGQGKDGDDGQGKDGDEDNGGTPPPAGDNGQGKDEDDGQGKDGDGDNGGTPPAGDNGQGKDGDDGQGKDDDGKGKDDNPPKPAYKVGKVRGFFLRIVQAILKKIKNPDGMWGKFFGGIESTLLLGAQETLPVAKPEPEQTKTPDQTKTPNPTKDQEQQEEEEDFEKVPGFDDSEWARDQVDKLGEMDKNSLMWKIIEGEYRKLLEDRKDKSDEDLQKMIEEEEIPVVTEKKGKEEAFQNILYYRISEKVLDMAEEKGISLEDEKGDRVIDDIYADLERKHLQEKTNEASRQAAENQQQGDGQRPKEPEGKEAPTDDQEK